MKKILLIIIFSISIIGSSYGAASSSDSGSSNYDKGVSLIKKTRRNLN